MADREVALERLERGLVEDLRDQAHVLVDQDLAAVADRDAGRLLAAVLEGVEAEVGELGDVLTGGPDTEDAAGVLGSAVLRVEVVRQAAVSATAALESLGWPRPECTCLDGGGTGARRSLATPRRLARCAAGQRTASAGPEVGAAGQRRARGSPGRRRRRGPAAPDRAV